jgi:predicted GIY-YIG superfamily endonuclease
MSASATADSFFVYILRCADDSFYIGHTSNLKQRVGRHNEGTAATWTASRRPVELVYQESCPSEEKAIRREIQLKHWTHAKKSALVHGDRAKLKQLAKRRIK